MRTSARTLLCERLGVPSGQTVARYPRRCSSTILQRIALELLTDRAAAQLLGRAEKAYAARRQAMLRALAAHGIEAFGRSGLNVWVPVAEEIGVVRALLDAGWAVSAGERFRIDSPPGIRIAISTLKEGEAEAVACCITESMQSLVWTKRGNKARRSQTLVIAAGPPDEMRGWLARIQNDLFDLGADLAVPLEDTKRERLRAQATQVDRLEQLCDLA
jgi:Cobalamin adenosyltransferase/Aminotransferase class I and II